MKYIGAHFSIGSGFDELVNEADSYGANAFALFTKPSTQWKGKIITEDVSDKFKNKCNEKKVDSNAILAHASYMINMANPNEAKRHAAKNAFIDEMKRCRQLGIKLLNFHPGSYLDGSIEEAIKNIGNCLTECIEEVPEVMPVLETMSGQGTNIGNQLFHLRDIIGNCKYPDKIGVCIDTCHSFAAGYDIRTEVNYWIFMDGFDEAIGLDKLVGMHLNDSKCAFESRKDRHEQLGKGFIGWNAFKYIIEDERTDGIPLILETPNSSFWKEEIKILKSFFQNK